MKIADSLDIHPKAGANQNKATMQLGRAWYRSTVSTPTWIHIKTNIPHPSGVMFNIMAEGYNYGTATAIDCSWCGYTYSGWGGINNRFMRTYVSGGLNAQDIYISSDGYVTLTANASSFYYIGFVMHAHFAQGSMPSGGFRVLQWSRQNDGTAVL